MDLGLYVDTADRAEAIEFLAMPSCALLDNASIPPFVLAMLNLMRDPGECRNAEAGRPRIASRRLEANLQALILKLTRNPELIRPGFDVCSLGWFSQAARA